MPMQAHEIEAMLRDAFPTADITVTGSDGVHMGAEIIAEEFKGKNRVQQQRMVFAALKGKMDGSSAELHALSLSTKAKE